MEFGLNGAAGRHNAPINRITDQYLPACCPSVHGTFCSDRLFDGLVVLARSDRMLDVGVGVLGECAWFFGLGAETRSRVVRAPVSSAGANKHYTF